MSNLCFGHSIELINFIIEKGANNWDRALFCAVQNLLFPEIADLMLKKGAIPIDKFPSKRVSKINHKN